MSLAAITLLKNGYYTPMQAKHGGKTAAQQDQQHSEMKRFHSKFVNELQREDWYQHFKVALVPTTLCTHPDRDGQQPDDQ